MTTTKILIDGASAAADADSGSYNVGADSFAIQITTTGSPVGTVAIRQSIDGSNWAPLPMVDPVNGFARETLSINGADTLIAVVDGFRGEYVRVYYTRASGTGAITATIREA